MTKGESGATVGVPASAPACLIQTIHGEAVAESELGHIARHFWPFAMRTSALLRDPKNARKHGEEDLPTTANSLKQFGFRKPIEFDPATKIIKVGNGRHEAAETILKWAWVPAVPLDGLDADKLRAYALADNRTAEKSTWDFDALAAAVSELEGVDLGFDLGDIGLGDEDLKEIEIDIDQTPAAEAKRSDSVEKTHWQIVITCSNERHQVRLLKAIADNDGAGMKKLLKGVEPRAL